MIPLLLRTLNKQRRWNNDKSLAQVDLLWKASWTKIDTKRFVLRRDNCYAEHSLKRREKVSGRFEWGQHCPLSERCPIYKFDVFKKIIRNILMFLCHFREVGRLAKENFPILPTAKADGFPITERGGAAAAVCAGELPCFVWVGGAGGGGTLKQGQVPPTK